MMERNRKRTRSAVSRKADDPKPFYRCHVFCCVNEREEGHPRGCCRDKGSAELRDYMKARAKELGLRRVRINQSGCLDRCELGPTVVIYPDGIWYTCRSKEDVDEILETHVRDGGRVGRLMMDKPVGQGAAKSAGRTGA